MTDDERAIRELFASWIDASERGDTDAVLSLMTEDVVFLVAGQPPFGRDAFAAANRARASDTRLTATLRTEELVVAGDVAYVRNHLAVTMTPGKGAPVRSSGYVLSVLRREPDGRWRLARDANLLTRDPAP